VVAVDVAEGQRARVVRVRDQLDDPARWTTPLTVAGTVLLGIRLF